MRYAVFVLSLMMLVSGCETMSETTSNNAPSNPLDLGDWSHASAATTLTQFQSAITARYPAGSSISDATADLRRSDFECAANNDTTGRGNPPTQICRKTVTADNCTGTWQVHLFDAGGNSRLVRARALYDKRCGREGLLGGPS